MTERLYRDSADLYNFLVMMRTMTLITLIMMIMTRIFILLLITIVNQIILDIAVLVRVEVSSHHNTSHTDPTPTPYDTLNSTNYTSTDIILTFTLILVFLSSFRHSTVPVFSTYSSSIILLFYRISYTCTKLFMFPQIKSFFTNLLFI